MSIFRVQGPTTAINGWTQRVSHHMRPAPRPKPSDAKSCFEREEGGGREGGLGGWRSSPLQKPQDLAQLSVMKGSTPYDPHSPVAGGGGEEEGGGGGGEGSALWCAGWLT